MLSDAKHDVHFEKEGVPLSALEIRDELLADGGQAVRRAFGPDRRMKQEEGVAGIDTYRWISWELTPTLTDFPNATASGLIVYDDDFFRANIWYRDNAPHWAYKVGFFLPVRHRSWIEWTPQIISSRVAIREDRVGITLISCTPNFQTYQMKRDQGSWQDCPDHLDLELAASGVEATFRSVNLAGVIGPEHRVQVVPVD
jgi:hypothetical protein